ncbi:hypothetical protein F5Y19DRAFT_481846 [Xylariaceae sp. FL1651]|nr:hypothetical protein F5Y19DRAFT_481846 [Xylariaceae sp. FL1651]
MQSALVIFLVVTSFLRPAAAAFDATKRDCSGICLTSFHWCSNGGRADSDLKGCSYPEYAYPYFNRMTPSNPAMLLLRKTYNITWKNADIRYPVRIQWSFTSGTDFNNAHAMWDTNTTDSHFMFKPYDIMNSFPTTQAPDISPVAANGIAANLANYITISQPEAPLDPGGDVYTDYSQQFIVLDDTARIFLDTAVEKAYWNLYHKWELGVSIGVGIGVPILVVLTALITKRANRGTRITKRGSEQHA